MTGSNNLLFSAKRLQTLKCPFILTATALLVSTALQLMIMTRYHFSFLTHAYCRYKSIHTLAILNKLCSKTHYSFLLIHSNAPNSSKLCTTLVRSILARKIKALYINNFNFGIVLAYTDATKINFSINKITTLETFNVKRCFRFN